jgi:nucleotide-binding universal stress UspA family protein
MKTILAPIDLSDAAEVVTTEAGALAKIIGARVLLLHVVMPSVINEYAPDAQAIASEGTGVAEEALIRLQFQLKQTGVEAESDLLNGVPITTILEEAVEKKADYIVMGSHGHGALYNLLVGGTALGVMQKAPCPVVIVPIRKAAASHPVEALHSR